VPLLRSAARALVPRTARNWLRSPAGTAQFLADAMRHAAGLDVTADLRPGLRLRCHPAAWRGAYHVHADDPPQAAELDAFLATCRPGMVLFDLGAHYGLFSIVAALRGGADALAVAVDPSAHALRMAAVNARLNGVADRVRVERAAAGAADGTTAMVDVGVQALGYFVRANADHGPAERTTVPVVTVDTLAARIGRSPTHLKVDVEGFEEDALRGAASTLRVAAPTDFLELHVAMIRDAGRDPAAPLDLLARAGYDVVRCDGSEARRALVLAEGLVRLVARPCSVAP
jgi:FkbM family methyltransferase